MFECESDTVFFLGELTEFPGEETFLSEFKKAVDETKKNENQVVKVSFEKTKHINSIGIRKLIKALKEIETPLNFVCCPVWLVDQFNMIEGFFGDRHIATSFYCPYYNDQIDDETIHLISVQKDFDLNRSLSVQDFDDILVDGKVFTPDFESGSYLLFLMAIEQRIRDFIEKEQKK